MPTDLACATTPACSMTRTHSSLRACRGLLAILLAFFQPAIGLAHPPPNVVFIISDDHHWRDYGFMGHSQIRTPHLDALSAQSRLFRRGYVPSSLCCPSLATMISGLYPHQNRITSNDPPLPASGRQPAATDPAFQTAREPFNRCMDQLPTLPRLLAAHGYVSFQTGKWWQGDFTRGGFTAGMTTGTRHGDAGLTIGRDTMQPMWEFMKGALKEQRPFFLWYAPFLPHSPHTPPERLLAKYRDHAPSLHVARYWAMVEWLDETCGQLLGFLDDTKIADNTLVIYVADNGWIQDPDSPRYAPRSKQSQYDGGLRTPIMVRWPARLSPSESADLACSIDLAPTVLKAAGLPVPAEMQGIDLLDTDSLARRKSIHGEIFTHDSQGLENPAASLRWRWIIDGHTKLIVPHPANEPGAPVELYDLAVDPDEAHNRAPSRPDEVRALTNRLDAWWKP